MKNQSLSSDTPRTRKRIGCTSREDISGTGATREGSSGESSIFEKPSRSTRNTRFPIRASPTASTISVGSTFSRRKTHSGNARRVRSRLSKWIPISPRPIPLSARRCSTRTGIGRVPRPSSKKPSASIRTTRRLTIIIPCSLRCRENSTRGSPSRSGRSRSIPFNRSFAMPASSICIWPAGTTKLWNTPGRLSTSIRIYSLPGRLWRMCSQSSADSPRPKTHSGKRTGSRGDNRRSYSDRSAMRSREPGSMTRRARSLARCPGSCNRGTFRLSSLPPYTWRSASGTPPSNGLRGDSRSGITGSCTHGIFPCCAICVPIRDSRKSCAGCALDETP